jgi:hypothetical protein
MASASRIFMIEYPRKIGVWFRMSSECIKLGYGGETGIR